MSSPTNKKQRACRTPQSSTSPPASSTSVFRPGRTKLFDDEKENLLKIRRGGVLQQPILMDVETEEQDKENCYSIALLQLFDNKKRLPISASDPEKKNGAGDL